MDPIKSTIIELYCNQRNHVQAWDIAIELFQQQPTGQNALLMCSVAMGLLHTNKLRILVDSYIYRCAIETVDAYSRDTDIDCNTRVMATVIAFVGMFELEMEGYYQAMLRAVTLTWRCAGLNADLQHSIKHIMNIYVERVNSGDFTKNLMYISGV